jgi:predicted PurR-regulated permease PerM
LPDGATAWGNLHSIAVTSSSRGPQDPISRPPLPSRAGNAGRGSRLLVLASVCVVVAAMYFAQDVLIPLALAVLLTFLLAPLVVRLERRRIGRVPSVLIVVTLALGLLATIGYVVYLQAEELGNDLPEYQKNITSKLERVMPRRGGILSKLQNTAEQISKTVASEPATEPTTGPASASSTPDAPRRVRGAQPGLPIAGDLQSRGGTNPATQPAGTKTNPIWVLVSSEATSPVRTISTTIGPLLSPLGTAGIVIVFTIFMLLAREDLRDRIIRLVGQGQLTVTTQALDDAAQRVSRYLLAQSIVNGTYGIAIAAGLWFIGVPNPLLFGLLCAILRFIPYIGPWIGATFPLIVSIGAFPGFRQFVETAGWFILIELISNNVVEPWLYGSSTGLSTLAVLVSAVFWTWLWGPVGLLLSTPLTVLLVVIGKYVPQLAFLDILLGDEPVLSPAQRLYQRLLALDQEEATELAREYQASNSLEAVYENVMLPALAMAEQDQHRGQLDRERQAFVRQAMRDIVDELGENERMTEIRRGAAETEEAVRTETLPRTASPAAATPTSAQSPASSDGQANIRATIPKGCTINVVCLPAHDPADEIVNLMLAQLLELRGYCAFSISQSALASEMVEEVAKRQADVVVISALPPSAVAHARYLCKRVHARFEDARMIIGLWLARGDVKRLRDRITCVADVQVVTTLEAMLEQVHQLAQPLIAKRIASEPA